MVQAMYETGDFYFDLSRKKTSSEAENDARLSIASSNKPLVKPSIASNNTPTA